MAARWQDFLAGVSPAAHAVEVYDDERELADSVARYLAAGFALGEPAVVVATPAHSRAFRERLVEDGWDAGRIEHSGLLLLENAASMLDAVCVDGQPEKERFDATLQPLLDRAERRAPGKRIRVFGEMVDLRASRGDASVAEQLEHLWNGLLEARPFSLLCGSRLDLFDREAQLALLPGICRVHSHVLAAHDERGLERAVERALDETLGEAKKRDIYYIVGNRLRGERVPVAQDALMWVSANMPSVADEVLDAAREHYRERRERRAVA